MGMRRHSDTALCHRIAHAAANARNVRIQRDRQHVARKMYKNAYVTSFLACDSTNSSVTAYNQTDAHTMRQNVLESEVHIWA